MRLLCIAALLAAPTCAQSFDVVSIKPLPLGEGKQRTFSLTEGGVTVRGASLREVIATAYGLKPYQIAGPSWLGDSYEIVAKTAAPADREQLKNMLRGMFAERFQMTSHRESKEQAVYAITEVNKSAALEKPSTPGDPRVAPAKGGLRFQNYSISKLADYLGAQRGMNRPVVDQSGLEGDYDFTIHVGDPSDSPMEAKRSMEAAFVSDSFLPMVASQLGLKVESRKAAMDILTIDRIERPSTN
jgi:uncharacterized protein (TIGR03435 family)